MKYIRLIIAVLSLGVLTIARVSQDPKPSPDITQTQSLELLANRETGPLVLFDRAVKDERGRCRVHHHPLKVAVVPVVYGLLPGLSRESYETERREFPNAILCYEGGCVLMGAKEAKVLHCPKCLEARKAWGKRQRGTS